MTFNEKALLGIFGMFMVANTVIDKVYDARLRKQLESIENQEGILVRTGKKRWTFKPTKKEEEP